MEGPGGRLSIARLRARVALMTAEAGPRTYAIRRAATFTHGADEVALDDGNHAGIDAATTFFDRSHIVASGHPLIS